MPNFGFHHSEESKKKMSISRTGKYLGINNPNYHRQITAETRLKMSLSHIGKTLPEEQKRKIGEANKKNKKLINLLRQYGKARRGIPMSKETKAKLSTSRIKNKNSQWKGGRIVDNNGYINILIREHPNAYKGGYVPEHRIIIEKIINRFLLSKEQAHHINKKRADNRPENLMAFSSQSAHRRFEMGGLVNPNEILFDGRIYHGQNESRA